MWVRVWLPTWAKPWCYWHAKKCLKGQKQGSDSSNLFRTKSVWSSAVYTNLAWTSTVLSGKQCLCYVLAAPAWHFVCYTESVGEGKEPVETDGKKPELTGPEPLQAVVENSSNQPEPSRVGVKEQAKSSNPAVKEEGNCSPPPPGKYIALILWFIPISLAEWKGMCSPL